MRKEYLEVKELFDNKQEIFDRDEVLALFKYIQQLEQALSITDEEEIKLPHHTRSCSIEYLLRLQREHNGG